MTGNDYLAHLERLLSVLREGGVTSFQDGDLRIEMRPQMQAVELPVAPQSAEPEGPDFQKYLNDVFGSDRQEV